MAADAAAAAAAEARGLEVEAAAAEAEAGDDLSCWRMPRDGGCAAPHTLRLPLTPARTPMVEGARAPMVEDVRAPIRSSVERELPQVEAVRLALAPPGRRRCDSGGSALS